MENERESGKGNNSLPVAQDTIKRFHSRLFLYSTPCHDKQNRYGIKQCDCVQQ